MTIYSIRNNILHIFIVSAKKPNASSLNKFHDFINLIGLKLDVVFH